MRSRPGVFASCAANAALSSGAPTLSDETEVVVEVSGAVIIDDCLLHPATAAISSAEARRSKTVSGGNLFMYYLPGWGGTWVGDTPARERRPTSVCLRLFTDSSSL